MQKTPDFRLNEISLKIINCSLSVHGFGKFAYLLLNLFSKNKKIRGKSLQNPESNSIFLHATIFKALAMV